ncbi:MAG: IS4/IS5 family transposase, partial [Thermodesulfobacteriota bacterium]
MPDTEENQGQWPQDKQQRPGCGFPTGRLTGCFSLQTGALLSYELSDKHQHELKRFRRQWAVFQGDDIFLGDTAYCNFYDISMLQKRGVDSVVTLARRTPVSHANAIKVLGKDDFLIRWQKPKRSTQFTKEEWSQVPEFLLLRQIKITIKQPGFRPTVLYVITT